MLVPGSLELLAATPATLRALLAGSPASLTSEPDAEGWSVRDVVAHLVSVHEPAFIGRVRLIAEGDEPPVPNVDEEAVLASSGLRERPLIELLDRFAQERRRGMEYIRSLETEAFKRGGVHEIAGRVTAADIVHHHVFHDLLHIEQICRLLAAPAESQRGAMRGSFPGSAA